jgi:Ca2+-transporting ATPase
MHRPPRSLRNPLFGRKSFFVSLMQGLSILAVVFGVFIYSWATGKGELEARTLSFATLVFANIMLILTNLSWSHGIFRIIRTRNPALWGVMFVTLLALFSVLYAPVLRELFHFSILHPADISLAFVLGISSLLWFEIVKKRLT